MQELCSSRADEMNDSIDLARLRALCAVADEVGYEPYQQSITSSWCRIHYWEIRIHLPSALVSLASFSFTFTKLFSMLCKEELHRS